MSKSHLDTEQNELICMVDETKQQFQGRGRGWNRLRGDATTRIVEHFIQRHLPKGFELARYAWVEGCEDEFDILLIDAHAVPFSFTNMYHGDDVHLIIEVKSAGVFYRKYDVENYLREWRNRMQKKTGKTLLYLSFWERPTNYNMVLQAFRESNAFVLKVKDEVKQGEWERFINRVRTLLPQTSSESVDNSKP